MMFMFLMGLEPPVLSITGSLSNSFEYGYAGHDSGYVLGGQPKPRGPNGLRVVASLLSRVCGDASHGPHGGSRFIPTMVGTNSLLQECAPHRPWVLSFPKRVDAFSEVPMAWHSPCTLRCYNSRGAQPKTIVGGSPTHGREAGWRLQRSCTPSGDREEATRGWFNPSWGAILSTVSWGSLPNLLPHLVREATLTLTRVGATDVWHLLRPNAPSLSAGNSERSRNGLAPLGSGEDRCPSLAATE